MGGRGKGKGGERGEDVEGPGKWSAPGPVLALGGPAVTKGEKICPGPIGPMYHHAKFHADRCHRRQDISNQTEKKTATNIPF